MLGIGRRRHERELADALAASQDAVQSGAASVEDCLRRYAPLAAELEPLLRTSTRLRTALRSEPSEAARLRARAAFLSAAAQRQPANVTPHPMVRRRAWVAFAPAAIAAALFAVIAVPVLGSMDSGATPGDWNYGFKRATERVRLALTTDSADRRTLRLEFAKRRLDEIERLSTTGHIEQHVSQVKTLLVEYTSDIQQVNSTLQSTSTLPDSEKQQITAVTDKANVVVTTVQSAAPTDRAVQDAAQQAQTATQNATTIAQTIPSPSKTAAAVVSSTRTPHPQPAATTPADSNTSTPPSTPAPTDTVTARSTTTPATATPAPTTIAAPSATPVPATASATASPTSPLIVNNVAPTSEPTPIPVPTRSVTTVPAIVPTAPPAATPAATAPEAADATGTPRTIGAAAAAGSTTAPRTATPPPATATPGTTATPPPAAPRVATVTPSLIMIRTGPDGTSYRWQGPPTPLDAVLPLPINQVAVVYYAEQNGATQSWYPGTPAPTITSGATFTVKQRSTAPRS